MKVQTKIKKILESDASRNLKIMQLQTLGLKTFAGSPLQKLVIATYQALRDEMPYHNLKVEDFYQTK